MKQPEAARIGLVRQRSVPPGRDRHPQLQQTLISRVVIEQANVVLAERLKIDLDPAFTIVRTAARNRNRLLADLARDITTGAAGLAQVRR